jgi:hypothetical protein
VQVTSGASNSNVVAIGTGFTVDDTFKVHYNATDVIIGSLNPGGGEGTTDMVVTFNTNATPAIVQALVRSLTFKTINGAAGTRTLNFTVSDGDGGVSNPATKTINVT